MIRRLSALALSALTFSIAIGLVSAGVQAATLPDGRNKTCTMPNGVVVLENNFNGPAAGLTSFTPVVRTQYNPALILNLMNLGANVSASLGEPLALEQQHQVMIAEFIFFHECAHARLPTTDEVLANCEATKEMLFLGEMSTSDLTFMGAFHVAQGPLAAIYHGSGATFWQLTMNCVNSPTLPTILASSPDVAPI
jgi:hypothetical protein